MENPIKMDDLGGKPTIFGNIDMEKSGKSFDSHPNFLGHKPGFPSGNVWGRFGDGRSRDLPESTNELQTLNPLKPI